MMSTSQKWDWNVVVGDTWLQPSIECQRVAVKWSMIGVSNILDMGCGIGRHTLMFAQMGMHVSAFDLSELAVKSTKKLLASEHKTADVIVADMLKMPYADETFDAVLASHVLSHANSDTINQAIGEIYRVMKPHAEAYITLTSKQSDDFQNESFPHYQNDENTRTIMKEGPEYGITHFYVDATDAEKLLQPNFDIIKMDHISSFHNRGLDKVVELWHYYILIRKR